MEFEKAPGMTMLHMSPVMATNLDTFVSPFVDPRDSLPPLEVDNVFCQSLPDGGMKPPLGDGTWEMEENCLSSPEYEECPPPNQYAPFSRSFYKLERAAATVSNFRLSPIVGSSGGVIVPLQNVMKLDLTIKDIDISVRERIIDAFGTQWYPPPGHSGSHGLHIDSVTVECELRPAGVVTTNGCGEPIVTCAPITDAYGPHLSITGLSGMMMGINLSDFEGVFERVVAMKLTSGVRLHFEGFSATGLVINSTASPLPFLLQMTGTFTDSCSHTPAPPPSTPAPIRGLVRVRASAGAGEQVQGEYVKPYRLRPEVKFDWTSEGQAATPYGPFLPWTPARLDLRLYGSELSKLQPDGTFVLRDLEKMRLEGNVELLREEIDTCWQKTESTEMVMKDLQTGFGECVNCLGEQSFLSVSFHGEDNLFTREVSALGGIQRVAIAGKAEVEFDSVLRILRDELGDAVCPGPNCPSSCPGGFCESWTRYDLVPSDLPDPAGGIPPVHFELWVHHTMPVPNHFPHFDPRECTLPPPADITDRRLIEPSVTFPRFQVDSAEFQSDTVETPFVDAPQDEFVTGLDPMEERIRTGAGGAAATRSVVADAEGAQSVRITTTSQCPVHGERDPHLEDSAGTAAPCWKGKFRLPQPGTVTVTRAFSGVTPTRFALDDTVFGPGASENSSELLGSQTFAVTGALDRSGLRFYTAVPQIYRDIGLTAETLDYRETKIDAVNQNPWSTAMYFDWQHGGSFPAPAADDDHLDENNHERWTTREGHRGHRFRYFANWNTDVPTARWVADDPPSFCLAPDKLLVTARKMSFVGAGLKYEKELDAGVVLTEGTQGTLGPQITKQGAATGTFWPVLH